MKHIKNNPPVVCEERIPMRGMNMYRTKPCYRPAKYERLFDDPKAKPMRLCGIHARQAKRKGYIVKLIGELP